MFNGATSFHQNLENWPSEARNSPQFRGGITQHRPSTPLQMASDLPDISKMRISELKKELESNGLSTKSFCEKSDLVEAVEKARQERKTPPISSSSIPASAPTTTTPEDIRRNKAYSPPPPQNPGYVVRQNQTVDSQQKDATLPTRVVEATVVPDIGVAPPQNPHETLPTRVAEATVVSNIGVAPPRYPKDLKIWFYALELSDAKVNEVLEYLCGDELGMRNVDELTELGQNIVQRVENMLPLLRRKNFRQAIAALKKNKRQTGCTYKVKKGRK